MSGHDGIHRYTTTARWSGSTGVGYDDYGRAHVGGAPPAPAMLALSGDPAFGGDGDLLNPEQLVVLAASSCQLLSFVAVAARARIDVVEYTDAAEAHMDDADRPVRLMEIVLRPVITLRPGPSEARVHKLVDLAHRECFVANSLATPIRIETTLRWVAG